MSAANSLRAALLCVFVSAAAAPLRAHPAPFSYLDLRLEQGRMEGKLTVHVLDLAHDLNVTPPEALFTTAEMRRAEMLSLLRTRLTLTADNRPLEFELARLEPLPEQQALALHLRFSPQTAPGLLSVRCALFPYDPQHQTFLNIYEEDALRQQEIFSRERTDFEYFSGSRQGVWAVVKRFVRSGVAHIFAGPDHILFIVGLLLLGGSLRRLLLIVTAFTLAHSLTLTLAALNVVNPPARIIEPAIALSIVYVGIDNLMVARSGGRDVRAWTAFFFGFIHGFGFAGVLREFGLPQQALGWSLFSFNVGVEIGQACIVVLAASLLTALRNHNRALSERATTVGSALVILAGSYWFIQRVFFETR